MGTLSCDPGHGQEILKGAERMYPMIKDSKWLCTQGRAFTVIGIRKQDDQTWVHYSRTDVDDERIYCCLEEAFLARFYPEWSLYD